MIVDIKELPASISDEQRNTERIIESTRFMQLPKQCHGVKNKSTKTKTVRVLSDLKLIRRHILGLNMPEKIVKNLIVGKRQPKSQ